ncbi:MAG: hypothetical protein J5781_02250, partial [Clostridia bacterium]|nr:hypothetical protein [Clostridia bacterium]
MEDMVAFSQAMQTSSGVGKRVELKADLDLTGSDFLPIGNSSHSFEGSFYGNDHTLTVDIDNNAGGATGVFAYTGSGCYITGLVVRGSVDGNNYVGGIVGDADGGRIEKCVSFVEVTGNTYVGGVVGSCKGSVTACSSFATVRGRNTFGGIVGILQGSRSSLTESVFIGKVVSNNGTTFGGLVGNSIGELKDNYAVPTFEGSLAVSYGSVVGTLSSVSKGVSYCYGISERSPVGSNSAGVLPETLASKTSYEFLSGSVGFAADTVLTAPAFEVGFGFYPCPSYQLTAVKDDFVEPYDTISKGKFIVCLFASGTGSASDPFTVVDERQWDLFVTNSRLYDYSDRLVVLGASVTAGSVRSVGSSSVPFAGIFDGRNNTLTFSCASVSDGNGLFAAVSGATIKNVILSGQVTGGQKVGLVAGCAKGVENSFIGIIAQQGSVVSGNAYVGTIVGGADEGTNIRVRSCASYASVYGGTHVGGLVGECSGQAYITESVNHGVVTDGSNGGRYVGGIFGRLSGAPHLSELTNKGRVNASGCTSVGGIGGSVSGATVSLCNCVSSVVGRFGVGGLFGEITDDVSLTSCAYIGVVTGVNGLGGAVGDLTSGLTLTVTDFYCAVSFVKDKSISLSAPFRAFCIASPQLETTTVLSGAY